MDTYDTCLYNNYRIIFVLLIKKKKNNENMASSGDGNIHSKPAKNVNILIAMYLVEVCSQCQYN